MAELSAAKRATVQGERFLAYVKEEAERERKRADCAESHLQNLQAQRQRDAGRLEVAGIFQFLQIVASLSLVLGSVLVGAFLRFHAAWEAFALGCGVVLLLVGVGASFLGWWKLRVRPA